MNEIIGIGCDSTGQFIATHDEVTFQLEIWDLYNKVEIFLEQREVAFLSPSKICKNLNFSG